MSVHLTAGRMIELAAAAAILVAGIVFYRRKDPAADQADHYGNQGAVILFVVAAIMGVHAIGGLDYRPSDSELDAMKERAR